jgi:hypothetical protein
MSKGDKETIMSEEQPVVTPNPRRKFSATKLIVPIVIVIIIGSQVWFAYRIYNLEKGLAAAHAKITALEGVLSKAQSDIGLLAAGLDYVTPLAENANFYAHSHPYSDSRLKIDIADIANPLEEVLALRGVRYRWNTKEFPAMFFGDKPQIGFIAQDVEQVYPELVTTAPNGYKMVDYARLTPILVEAMREQQVIIVSLEQRVSALENQR